MSKGLIRNVFSFQKRFRTAPFFIAEECILCINSYKFEKLTDSILTLKPISFIIVKIIFFKMMI